MTADLFYRITQDILGKNQQGYLPPDQFNRLAKAAQDGFANFLIGEFQQYQSGNPQSRVQFGQNQIVRQRLTPVIYGYNLNVDSTGFSPYPSDFEQVDAMYSIYGYSRIRFIQQNQLHSVYNDDIDPIATNPIYLIEDRGFRFFPTTTAQAKLSYIKTPPAIVWGYTLDANSRPVYSAAASVDPVWSDMDCMEIISRLLRMVGVSLQAQDVNVYANEIKNQGQ